MYHAIMILLLLLRERDALVDTVIVLTLTIRALREIKSKAYLTHLLTHPCRYVGQPVRKIDLIDNVGLLSAGMDSLLHIVDPDK